MDKAERQGAWVVRFLTGYFQVLIPISIFLMSAAALLYHKWQYGYIDPNKLKHNCRVVYEIFKQFYH